MLAKIGAIIAFLASCAGIIALGIAWLQLQNDLKDSEESAKRGETSEALILEQRDLLGTIAVADSNTAFLQETQNALNIQIATFAPDIPTIQVAPLTPTFPLAPTDTQTPTITPTPTDTLTPLPTNTPIPSPTPIPLPFEDNFDAGPSSAWTVEFGNPFSVNGRLATDVDTLLTIGNATWRNYEITFDAWPHTYRLPDYIGVRMQEIDNLLSLKWGINESNWFFVADGEWQAIPGANTGGYLGDHPIGLRIVVRDNEFVFYIRDERMSSFVRNEYPTGYIGLFISPGSNIDNFKIVELP